MLHTDTNWSQYYKNVMIDYQEMKEQYPFCCLTILPTFKPTTAMIRVIAANKDLIEMVGAIETDFTKEFSRELYIEVPVDYRESGCKVFGAKWVDLEKLDKKDIHFYDHARLGCLGYELCVGLPESFPLMKNVILENVRTAENMLIAYEKLMTGVSDKLELIAYAHGETGSKQFQRNRDRYIPRR